ALQLQDNPDVAQIYPRGSGIAWDARQGDHRLARSRSLAAGTALALHPVGLKRQLHRKAREDSMRATVFIPFLILAVAACDDDDPTPTGEEGGNGGSAGTGGVAGNGGTG